MNHLWTLPSLPVPAKLNFAHTFNCMAIIISTWFSDYGHTLGETNENNIKHPFNKTVYNTCVLTEGYRQGCFFRGCQVVITEEEQDCARTWPQGVHLLWTRIGKSKLHWAEDSKFRGFQIKTLEKLHCIPLKPMLLWDNIWVKCRHRMWWVYNITEYNWTKAICINDSRQKYDKLLCTQCLCPCALLGTLNSHHPNSITQQSYGKEILCSYFIDKETEGSRGKINWVHTVSKSLKIPSFDKNIGHLFYLFI